MNKEKTKIQMGILGPGFFYLPDNITLYCPHCGERVSDKGKCICSLGPSTYDGGFAIITDCKKCHFNKENPVGIKPSITI